MCGIAGIISTCGCEIENDLLSLMIQTQRHRGPDGQGIYNDGCVGLAHCRLAIIDPQGGEQPFQSEDGHVVVTYNGEIYNYMEIQQELAGEYCFRTSSDTEVLINAYRKWGIDCIHRFRGMFAFVLYDKLAREVYVVRDRVGIKPLHYSFDKNYFAFASELGPLTQIPWISQKINPDAIIEYFSCLCVSGARSIYSDIKKLEQGHYLKLDLKNRSVEKVKYWEAKIDIRTNSEKSYMEDLDSLLSEIMRIYVRSDVPFGAFLSGGVDSSTVTAYMGRCLNNPVKTYTIGYQDNAFSELPYAEMAAKILKTVHCSYVVDANYSEEFIVNLIRHFGEPFADSSAIPTFFVSQLAAKNVKMVLSGDGGDELFGGYNSYRDIFVQSCRNSSFSGTILNMIGSILRRDDSGKSFTSIQQSQRNLFNFEDLQSLVLDKSLVKKRICEKTTDVNMINCFQLQDFKSYLVDDVLTKVDRMSMANSLEVRVPLLDHNLVEFAFSLPLNQKIRCVDKQIVTKYLLKSVAHTSFPQDFLERPKQGFGIPIANWLASRGLSSVKNIINKNNPIFEFLSYEATSRIVNRFVSGEQDQAAKVWSLLIFSLWLGRVHMKTDTAEQ